MNSLVTPVEREAQARASDKHARATIEDQLPADMEDLVTDEKSFGIRMIDTLEGRSKASLLINKMYSWRGYSGTHKLSDDPNRITLSASNQGEVVGTLTLGIDSEIGIMADEIFKPEVDAYRAKGARVCEITKLAFDSEGTKEQMASLFHLAVMYARDLHNCTHIFIEINPRHRRFYETMLGFQRLGELRTNPRVDAPAYLLVVDLDFVTREVQRVGGKGAAAAAAERSFYAMFYSPREEQGILQRLKNIQ
ncbi:N-acyl amino acid synthase FeeM domain-containing protein [Pseudoduganella violaceinigra]|uniref:N-acyl amino acid synthase FeeM domain-containing protein n=1 Tax=Pseudoduganella violaceinigra TaxID=246602 RepID=UPI001E311D79|nr:N-acetyltransferase [Pseudoduganella violaceinigra]